MTRASRFPHAAPPDNAMQWLDLPLAARLPDLRNQSLAAIHLVMSLRLCALAEVAGREPLAALACRLGSVTAAQAVFDLTDRITRAWPDRFATARPCCPGMTPDEWTVAMLARAARQADRPGFAAVLDGFVRAERHDALFAATVAALAAIDATC